MNNGPTIDPEIYRKVEGLLYNYRTFGDAIISLETELEEILPSPGSSVVVMGHNAKSPLDTSQTERWALIRTEGPTAIRIAKLLEKKKNSKARVDRALPALSVLQRRFVELKYFADPPMSHAEAMKRLQLPRMSYFRFKRNTIKKLAWHMGLT